MNIQLSKTQAVELLMEHNVFGADYNAYDACDALIDYLFRLEAELDEDISLDPVLLRCTYRMATLDEFREDYNIEGDVDAYQYLEDNTTIIDVHNDIHIIQEF